MSGILSARRSGTALVLVIALVASVSVIGLAYIEDNGTTVQGSFNLCRAVRARHIAESGVEHAIYWLSINDPPGANADGYWPGATNQNVDDSADYYDVSVVRDADDSALYRITSIGHWVGGAGSPGLAHRVIVWVRTSPESIVRLPYGLHLEAFDFISDRYTIVGDVHSNDSIVNQGTIQGNLTAAGFAVFTTPPTGTTASWQPTVTFPSLVPGNYLSYTLDDIPCSAVEYDHNDLGPSFASHDPSGQGSATWHISLTNPGGVLHATHHDDEVKIRSGVNFTGTIVIDGNVRLEGDNVTLTAMPGFPALVVNGNIYVKQKDKDIVINGAVICSGGLWRDGDIDDSTLTINGPTHFGVGISSLPDYGGLIINHVPERAWLYDFSIPPDDWPINEVTVESWRNH